MTISELIKRKYKISEKIYTKVFKDEDIHTFLSYFDIMNMYPLFPRPPLYLINTKKYSLEELENVINKEPSKEQPAYINKFVETSDEQAEILRDRINKFMRARKGQKSTDKIRYFFSYEIIDYITDNYDGEYVTNAWTKCYEILELFQLLNKNDKDILYFGTCEQPGAFIYCINHYVKTKIKPESFSFYAQSLKPEGNDFKTFRAENELFSKYSNNYDYAGNNGDITNINNIKHYRKKYYDKHFSIITADCGQDASEDFSKQEENIAPVLLGQFLNAIGISDKGTSYFFKLYCVYEKITAQVVYLASLFFETVYLTRVLKTKITSNEIYCVCKNFKFTKNDMNPILTSLYKRYEQYLSDKDTNIITVPEEYIDFILATNKTLLHSKLLSINFMHFRAINYRYIKDNHKVREYVNKQADHYVKYFCDLYNIEKLDPASKLVEKKFINKWKK